MRTIFDTTKAPQKIQVKARLTATVIETPDGLFDQTIAFGPDCIFEVYTPCEMAGRSKFPDFSCDIDFDLQPWNNWEGGNVSHSFAPTTKWSGFANIEYDLEMLA